MRTTLILLISAATALTGAAQDKSATISPELEAIVRDATVKATHEVLGEKAQQKFSTSAGHAYVLKFLQSISKSIVEAMRACDTPAFKPDASEVMIFLVSIEGHVDSLFHEPKNPYAECIREHLHLPKIVPKPPSALFPVQVRVVNGPRKVKGPDEPFVTMSLPDKK